MSRLALAPSGPAPHSPEMQSPSWSQICPSSHLGQSGPPQSFPVSNPFLRSSPHVAAEGLVEGLALGENEGKGGDGIGVGLLDGLSDDDGDDDGAAEGGKDAWHLLPLYPSSHSHRAS